MDIEQIKTQICGLDFFKDLNEQDLLDISQIIVYKTFKEGECIIHESDEDNKDLYIIIEGTATTKIQTKESDKANIYVIRKGQIFGELSMIADAKRSATIDATSDVQIFSIPKKQFEETATKNAHLGMVVYRNIALVLAERIRKSNKMLKHTILWGW